MEEKDFPLVENKIKKYELDPEYEYGEVTFTFVQRSLLKEYSKQAPEMSDEDPRKEKFLQLVTYYDTFLTQEGWEHYEVCMKPQAGEEVRRFRRKLK